MLSSDIFVNLYAPELPPKPSSQAVAPCAHTKIIHKSGVPGVYQVPIMISTGNTWDCIPTYDTFLTYNGP